MKKLHLMALALVLSVFMGHAKKGKHGGHHASHQKPAKHMMVEGGKLTGFGVEVGAMGTDIVSVTSPKGGKFVAITHNQKAGDLSGASSYFAGSVARYGMNGKLEAIFEDPSYLEARLPHYYPQIVVEDHRGGYVVGFTNASSYELVRYHADGSIDSGFQFMGHDQSNGSHQLGKLHAVVMQHDGKILVGSDSPEMPLARFDEHGALDKAFTDAVATSKRGLNKVTAVAIGMTKTSKKNVWRIVVAGTAHKDGKVLGAEIPAVMKFDMNGDANQWFNFAGAPADAGHVHFNAVAPYLNSHVLLAGYSDQGPLLWRVNGLGELDQVFGDYVVNSTPMRAVDSEENAEEPTYRLYGMKPSAGQQSAMMQQENMLMEGGGQVWDMYGSIQSQGLPAYLHAATTNHVAASNGHMAQGGMHNGMNGMHNGMNGMHNVNAGLKQPRDVYNALLVDEHDGSIIVAGRSSGTHLVLRRYSKQGVLDHKAFGANGTVHLYNGNVHAIARGDNKTMLVAGKMTTSAMGSLPVMYNLKM